jgi:predicted histone-like DNA-binding protein
MSIQYKMRRKIDNLNDKETKKSGLYPVVIRKKTVSLNELVKIAAGSGMMREFELEMALKIVLKTIEKELLKSNHVNLDGFGTFSLGASSRHVESDTEIRAESISVKKVTFKTSPHLLFSMKKATFVKGK